MAFEHKIQVFPLFILYSEQVTSGFINCGCLRLWQTLSQGLSFHGEFEVNTQQQQQK